MISYLIRGRRGRDSIVVGFITTYAINVLCNQIRVMVFDATFNNISVISWLYVLLVKETGVPRENQRPATTH
jgi:hypothetical protein